MGWFSLRQSVILERTVSKWQVREPWPGIVLENNRDWRAGEKKWKYQIKVNILIFPFPTNEIICLHCGIHEQACGISLVVQWLWLSAYTRSGVMVQSLVWELRSLLAKKKGDKSEFELKQRVTSTQNCYVRQFSLSDVSFPMYKMVDDLQGCCKWWSNEIRNVKTPAEALACSSVNGPSLSGPFLEITVGSLVAVQKSGMCSHKCYMIVLFDGAICGVTGILRSWAWRREDGAGRVCMWAAGAGNQNGTERGTGRKASSLQMEEIGCKCQTFLSLS